MAMTTTCFSNSLTRTAFAVGRCPIRSGVDVAVRWPLLVAARYLLSLGQQQAERHPR